MIPFYLFIFYLILQFIQANDVNYLNCGGNAYKNYKKYFIMRNDSCVLPQSVPSITDQSAAIQQYAKISNSILLFKVISGSGVKPYDYFVNVSDITQKVEDNVNNLSNFRSILLDEWNNVRPISMKIILKDYNNKPTVELLFNVTDTDSNVSWFNINNLLSSSPWDYAKAKTHAYNFFSIIGDRMYFRSFYINFDYRYCNDTGMMVIIEKYDLCVFGRTWKNGKSFIYPQILYVHNGAGEGGDWNTYAIPLQSLEIIGTYHSSVKIYNS